MYFWIAGWPVGCKQDPAGPGQGELQCRVSRHKSGHEHVRASLPAAGRWIDAGSDNEHRSVHRHARCRQRRLPAASTGQPAQEPPAPSDAMQHNSADATAGRIKHNSAGRHRNAPGNTGWTPSAKPPRPCLISAADESPQCRSPPAMTAVDRGRQPRRQRRQAAALRPPPSYSANHGTRASLAELSQARTAATAAARPSNAAGDDRQCPAEQGASAERQSTTDSAQQPQTTNGGARIRDDDSSDTAQPMPAFQRRHAATAPAAADGTADCSRDHRRHSEQFPAEHHGRSSPDTTIGDATKARAKLPLSAAKTGSRGAGFERHAPAKAAPAAGKTAEPTARQASRLPQAKKRQAHSPQT